MHAVYLHGFASSPSSSKALFLGERLAASGITLHCPDLNEPNFSTLTVSRMIGQVERLIAGLEPGPVALVGSSLGAFVALHAAERRRRLGRDVLVAVAPDHPIERLVLLAPALDFGANRMKHLGPDGLAHWRMTNRLEVEHYAEGRVRTVHYDLYEDARQYDSFAAAATLPTLILQGRHDEVVDPEMVERYARGRRHVTLVLLDDDHQLKASLELVWRETAVFLGLPASTA
ncbi:MAG: YqiA/YcfP family alpha/beta fold hydrolase [Vicinamibacterales bacterium]|nr:YqiA/YcfP family alpha/beta fold hydrolase [Vicinamibacterales bacterium]MDP7691983.1 YqiA/YcfP family alpha/beta fold hydrolase [Vicinamibacterales bacterium]HJN45323.1 YqiA/YcfP family alpha/beta fold hydrolase [Vicinamibacterales bacterium]